MVDLSGNVAGTFAGFGCHLNAEIAAIRAITETAQARCCYISGARDDLFRRQFLLMKRMDQHKLDAMFSDMPLGLPITSYRVTKFPDVKSETALPAQAGSFPRRFQRSLLGPWAVLWTKRSM